MHVDLSATSIWKIDLDITDDEGPVDMTGLSCIWVMSTRPDNTEVARATTASGTIVAVTGTTAGATGRTRLQITIDDDAHPLSFTGGFVMIDGDLSLVVTGGYEWLGKKEFRVWAGPHWTGATGA